MINNVVKIRRKKTYVAPVCNHTDFNPKHNLGYTVGIMKSGVPYEAEFAYGDDTLLLGVILPVLFSSNSYVKKEETHEEKDKNVLYFFRESTYIDYSVLDVGMVDNGLEEDIYVIEKYVDYLMRNGLVQFSYNDFNGTVFYRTDINGNDYVKVLITLTEGDYLWASSDIEVKSFAEGSFHVI